MPARRRAVGLGQEHARAGARGPRPARVRRGVARAADRRRDRPGDRAGRGCRGARGARVPGPREPDRHGAGRGRRRVRAREPRLAARRDARAGPRGARRGRAGRARAPTHDQALGWPAAAARAGRGARAAARDPRPRRAHRKPRPARRPGVRGAPRGPAPLARRDHRPRGAPGRRRVAHRRPGACARVGRAPDRFRPALGRAREVPFAARRGGGLAPGRGRGPSDRVAGHPPRGDGAGHPRGTRSLVRVRRADRDPQRGLRADAGRASGARGDQRLGQVDAREAAGRAAASERRRGPPGWRSARRPRTRRAGAARGVRVPGPGGAVRRGCASTRR